MTNETKRPGIKLPEFSTLAAINQDELERLLSQKHSTVSGFTAREEFLETDTGDRFIYRDLLAMESARQLVAQGLALTAALGLIAYTGAVRTFTRATAKRDARVQRDFWVARMGMRTSQPASKNAPTSIFGPAEYASTSWARGTFSEVMNKLQRNIGRDNTQWVDDLEHASVCMSNISAADRRLRTRIDEKGPALGVFFTGAGELVGP